MVSNFNITFQKGKLWCTVLNIDKLELHFAWPEIVSRIFFEGEKHKFPIQEGQKKIGNSEVLMILEFGRHGGISI